MFFVCENSRFSRRSRRFTQTNPKTPKQHYPQTICLSLRNNAACCIPLRDLRYLRENIHMRVLNQSANKKPQYLPQIPQIYADETQKPKTTLTSPTCLSLRNNAACCIPLCVICVICGRITRKSTQSIRTEETQKSPADLADLRRQKPKPQKHINHPNLSFSAK